VAAGGGKHVLGRDGALSVEKHFFVWFPAAILARHALEQVLKSALLRAGYTIANGRPQDSYVWGHNLVKLAQILAAKREDSSLEILKDHPAVFDAFFCELRYSQATEKVEELGSVQRRYNWFFKAVGKPLQYVSLLDIQTWLNTLTGANNSKRRALLAVKSQKLIGVLCAHGLRFRGARPKWPRRGPPRPVCLFVPRRSPIRPIHPLKTGRLLMLHGLSASILESFFPPPSFSRDKDLSIVHSLCRNREPSELWPW
jgi:hypothetical protein